MSRRSRKLPDLIREAKRGAEVYRVKRAGQSWRLWKFLGWDRGGWGCFGDFKTSEEAWVSALDRMGLLEPEADKPAQVPAPTFVSARWDYGGYEDFWP